MISTFAELAHGYLGVLVFTALCLPFGYLAGYLLNIAGFRASSPSLRVAWSACLSVPLTIELCTELARMAPNPAVLSAFGLTAVAGGWLMMRDRSLRSGKVCRATTAVLGLLAALGLYIVLAVTDIGIGHRLYVSTVVYDWSVRVPMVAAAMRSGVPPINGLGALGGHPAALRYFYFWYVVCADVGRLARIPARSALAASCVWASWALLGTFFLMLRHMVGIKDRLREHCMTSFLVLAVMGLDLIPTLPLLLSHRLHPYAEMEWWHQDRTPSFLSSCLYAPHHLAAFASLLTGLLLIRLTVEEEKTRLAPWTAAVLAGICFAAASGTAILPTLVVAIACFIWAADLALQRRFRAVCALAGSALTALLLARNFLHELQTTDSAVAESFASIHIRNWDFVRMYQAKYHAVTHHPWLDLVLAAAGVLSIHLVDLGFYLFVLVHRVRLDWGRRLTVGERAMWAFFIGTAIPYLFLSSASIASPNDLGVDAGLLLRLLMQMWAVPWVYGLWAEWQQGRVPWKHGSGLRRTGLALAGLCFVVGLAGEAFQVLWERIYFPLVGSQTLHKQLDILTTDRLSERLYNIREAYRALDRLPGAQPASAAIQYNPVSPMQPALTFYGAHQIAAFDIGCGTGYGGNLAACRAIMPDLLRLYGNTEAGFARGRAGNDRQDAAVARTATKEDAEAACRTLYLVALMAESTDSVWARPESWVWTMQPVVANETVRIFRCPEGVVR